MMKKFLSLIALVLALAMFAGCAAGSAAPAEKAEHPDLAPTLLSAKSAYDGGTYAESLELYLSAMALDSKSMDARLGVARCQMQLGNYGLADVNLGMAAQIDPENEDLYTAYAELSELSGEIQYAQTAVSLARENNVESFLSRVPEKPVIVQEPGVYSEKIALEFSHSDPDAEIIVTVDNDLNHDFSIYNQRYSVPVQLMRGTSHVRAYAVKDGIPSSTAYEEFVVDYEEYEVIFLDPMIELLTREELGIYDRYLTNFDCENVTTLEWYRLQNTFDSYREYENVKLNTLEDLKHFPALAQLYLDNQNAGLDYSPLAYCPNLFYLSLSSCSLKNTDFLKYAPNVTYLMLDNNEIQDITELSTRKNLFMLSMTYNDGDVDLTEVIRNNKQIDDLSIDDTMLSDYSLLSELPDLYYLRINGIAHADVAEIGKLTSLEYLYLFFNNFRNEYRSNVYLDDLSFLDNLENLQCLGLDGVRDPEQAEHIMGLKNLSDLYLYDSDIAENASVMSRLQSALPNCQIRY